MLHTRKEPVHPRRNFAAPRSTAAPAMRGGAWPQPRTRQLVKRPIILLVADAELFPLLDTFLGRQTYAIYAALDLFSAQALLKLLPVDLVLFHCPLTTASSAWAEYHQLRRQTTQPVLWLPTITAAHFVPTHDPGEDAARQRDLATYRQLIELFCSPFASLA